MTYNTVIPIAIIILFLVAGLLLEKLLGVKLKKITGKDSCKPHDIIFGAFKGMTFLWFFTAGAYFSLLWEFSDKSWMKIAYKIFISITIAVITVVVMKITAGLIQNYSKKAEGVLPSTTIFTNLAKFLVLIIGILVLLQYLGISITPVLTALGVGGLAVALALQDTLSNTFAGIQILLSRQIRPGDYVRLDSGDEGHVTDISWRNTSIRTASNNMIIIPNSKLSNAIVTNFELPEKEMSVTVNVGVSYSSDLEIVERIVGEAGSETMKEVSGGVADFEPFIRYNAFSDSRIDFSVILKVKSFSDQYIVRHEFIKRLHKRFNEEGIEIPFPTRTIQMKKDVEQFNITGGKG